MGLRDEQRALTQQKVLDAVLELLTEGALDVLSVPAVAKRSGVSVATIYRHFPTKDELITAAAAEPARRATSRAVSGADDPADEFVRFVSAMWREFDGSVELLRHQLVSQAGRDMRQIRLGESQTRLAQYVESRGVDPDSAAGKRLISMLLLVSGSQALLELHDHQQLDIETSIESAVWGVEALVAAAQRDDEATPKNS